MSCDTYGRESGYFETVCIEGGVLAAKGFLGGELVAMMLDHTPSEFLVSSRVADDRGVETFELRGLGSVRLLVGGTEVWRFHWRLVEPVPLGVDPRHAWDTRDKSANLGAFESIDLGMTESEVARLPFFRGFPEHIVYFLLPRDGKGTEAHISRCELHGYVSFCMKDGRVVAKGLPTWPEWEGQMLVVEADFAAKLDLEGSEWVGYTRSPIDCSKLRLRDCDDVVRRPGGIQDILRIERR